MTTLPARHHNGIARLDHRSCSNLGTTTDVEAAPSTGRQRPTRPNPTAAHTRFPASPHVTTAADEPSSPPPWAVGPPELRGRGA